MDTQGFRPVFTVDPQDTEKGLSLSLYFEKNDFSRLLQLVRDFGMLKVFRRGDDFLISLGSHDFMATNRLDTTTISLVNAKQFDLKDARRFLLLADLVFHDRKHPFKIKSPNLDDEFLTWTTARELNIAIESDSPEQTTHFHHWELEEGYRKRLIFSHTQDDSSTGSHQGFQRDLNAHEVTLYVETMEMLRILDMMMTPVSIAYMGDHFSLELPDMSLNVTQDFHKCTLNFGNINSMTPGASELIAKIIDLLFYDRKQQTFRFEFPLNRAAEKALYNALRNLNIPVQAINIEQAQRFQAAQKTLSAKTAAPTTTMLQTENTQTQEQISQPETKKPTTQTSSLFATHTEKTETEPVTTKDPSSSRR